jgi:hemoglobin
VLNKTVFELAGGEETFRQLVDRFYARVATDPVLRPVYPQEDLSDATERLTLFLIQYWGGPTTYSDQRGHPRLRLRHMTAAVDSMDLAPGVRKTLLDYFEVASTAMINRPGSS